MFGDGCCLIGSVRVEDLYHAQKRFTCEVGMKTWTFVVCESLCWLGRIPSRMDVIGRTTKKAIFYELIRVLERK